MSDFPLIIGHRGASAVAPENSLAAFTRAIQDGADGIEFDVRLSSDGVPVVIHDATLARTGLVDGFVNQLSADTLMKTDVGSWFRGRTKTQDIDFSDQRLPSLEQVFDLFAENVGLLYLEMKSHAGDEEQLAVKVVEAIKTQALNERVIVSSFDLSLIERVKAIDPVIRTAALFEPKLSRPATLMRRIKLVDQARACGADEICLHYALAGRRLTELARKSHFEVVVWTVDNPEWIELARSRGIKALITNNPARMLQQRDAQSQI